MTTNFTTAPGLSHSASANAAVTHTKSAEKRHGGHKTPLTPRARALPSWSASVVYSAAWLVMLFVLYLWTQAGGVQSLLDDPASSESLNSLGRLLGLIASAALLIQVLLMARIPIMEEALGHDCLTYMHRILGFSSFFLILAHIVLVVFAQVDLTDNPAVGFIATFWDMTWNYPGMLMAVAGTAALIMVVLTSIKAARSSMRYENWHLIHLYAYLGVAFAQPHQLWTGTSFLSSPLAQTFWWGLWIASAGSVIVYRLLLPAFVSLRHDLRVESISFPAVPGAEPLVRVVLRGRKLDRMRVAGGQFFNFRFAGAGVTRALPLSLSADPTAERLEITAAVRGPKTTRLASLKPGTRVFIEGPYGRFHKYAKAYTNTAFIASGTGIMPIISLMESMGEQARGAVLILRAGNVETSPYFARVQQLTQQLGVKVVVMGGSRKDLAYRPATLSQAFSKIIPNIARTDVFICGSTGWMNLATSAARKAGAGTIHAEKFSI
ncbi:ferredoxin reductase family protein [Corynebacterium callunae]|uniref:ferredoxin reductase family protein n=1 Tax=Corynebacterium callunae TaxID=1721 RepID=UPI00034A678F|nr:ferric reductase-like transmembrane domain-containing protein [Corynebacterium callunae]